MSSKLFWLVEGVSTASYIYAHICRKIPYQYSHGKINLKAHKYPPNVRRLLRNIRNFYRIDSRSVKIIKMPLFHMENIQKSEAFFRTFFSL